MSVELRVPSVGESITEVQIGQWLKAEGNAAQKDEPLVEIESDKATVELVAPRAGRVAKVLKRQGETAAVNEVIGYFDEAQENAEDRKQEAEASGAATGPAESHVDSAAGAEPAPPADSPTEQQPSRPVSQVPQGSQVPEQTQPSQRRPPGDSPADSAAIAEHQPSARPSTDEQLVPMSTLRRRVAERLVEAQHTAALLTTFNEIDLSAVIALRTEHRESFLQTYGVKLGFMSFFVKAVIEALKQVPQLNAEIRGADIVYYSRFDIGVAVSSGKGLVVPVLRGADRMSFADIERAIDDFARRAKDNKIKLEELQDGTFTISNGGIYGSLLSTPIVNPPQSGILGMHAIQERPVAREGQVVIRPMMYVALTYDHRLVDGRDAVLFLKHVKELVEQPARILLEV